MNDYMLTAPPGDGITSLAFNPSGNNSYLAVGSWDSTLRVYDVLQNIPKATHYFDGAILSCCYNTDGSQTYCAGLDAAVHVLDHERNSKFSIGSHAAPVSSIAFNSQNNTILSGSWDKSLAIWDTRQMNMVTNLTMPDKVYSISSSQYKVVVATAGKHVIIYDIRNMSVPEQVRESPLKHQTRTVRCSPEGTSYAIGSIEGRIAIEYFDMNPDVQSAKYAFKCHRKEDLAYPVNCLEYHPIYGTFASGGCDGIINVWDGNNRKRLCSLGPYPASTASMAFNNNGSILAVAASYTFEEGEKVGSGIDDNIVIHQVSEHEVRPKAKA